MARRLAVSRARLPWLAGILLAVGALVGGLLAYADRTPAADSKMVIGSDTFDRAAGGLGAAWTSDSDGGLSIVSGQVAGNGQNSGDIRTGESYPSDQFAQLAVGSAQLSGSQWIGPAVRMQDGGQSAYVGFYYWNHGQPEVMLFLRNGGNWKQLGSTYDSGVLPAGTQLQVTAVGSTISLLENGVVRVTATDTNLTGGAPGILAFGAATAGAWSGGSVGSGPGSGRSTYSVGGRVSGLSGTVVLQDNGSDPLNVNANGSFTFATRLASGAAYAVTVQSNPSGQTCTVFNGSGTVGSADVTKVTVSCAGASAGGARGSGSGGRAGDTVIGSDSFDRADGGLGAGWTSDSDGGLSIVSGQVVGNGQNSGDIRTAGRYPSDQFAQLALGSTQLSGSQWIGPAVRMQDGGQSAYVGFYYWNQGHPEVMLFLRHKGAWTVLGGYDTGALPPGTMLTVIAVGNTISLQVNGVQRVGAANGILTGGAPGILASGSADAGAWHGGSASFQVSYASTNADGVESYDVVSANDGDGPQILRVLTPTHPAAGVAHNFLIVLPVEAGLGATFGDGLATLESLDAQDKYNLTIIEPTFAIDPWYANNPDDPRLQYETFMTRELVPWIKRNLATTGHEQIWLIGFSKSGLGAQDLILKHPGLFTLAATWDFPADMATYDGLGADPAANYGTDANYQANYRLTQAFVAAHKTPFLTRNRIWIGSYALYGTDVSDYDALLTSAGIAHTTETPQAMTHRWDSGWVPLAMAALYQDSLHQ
jgi:Putative esterase